MPKIGLDAIEGVKNKVHRAVLLALRDTDRSVQEIARSLEITTGYIYAIAHRHLPRGYLHARKKSSKAVDSPADTVHIVPPIGSKPTLAKRTSSTSAVKQVTQSTPGPVTQQSTLTETANDKPQAKSSSNKLTLRYNGVTFQLEETDPNRQFESLCSVLRACRAVLGESL